MPVPFDEAYAATYDTQFAKLAPLRDALHLVTRLALEDLREDAHILSVGAGTGAEILHLAGIHPSWSFTAVDTSAPMLDRCRARVAAEGVGDRVHFHVGDVHSLSPEAGPFHGATAILVSQFVIVPTARQQFFQGIADRLALGAPLVFAELAMAPADNELREIWQRAQVLACGPVAGSASAAESAAKMVSIVPPDEIERLVQTAGFSAPAHVFQTLMIHGWTARRR